MRRLTGDEGATAVLVALLAVVLFGFGAFAIDISSLWSERRQLQSGSDAAALAVAQSCAAGDCNSGEGYAALAAEYANDNANDGAANVGQGDGDQQDYICGNGPNLPECLYPPFPAADVPGEGWVRVRAQTGDGTSSGVVPPTLAKALVPDYDGSTVQTYSIANWGAAEASGSGVAITFGECEWAQAVGATTDENGDIDYDTVNYAPDPVYAPLGDSNYDPDVYNLNGWPLDPDDPTTTLERNVIFHNPFGSGTDQPCDLDGAAGAGADLPGGFGWLDTNGDSPCTATMVDGVFYDNTGNDVEKECGDYLAEQVGTTILIPVYYDTNDLSGTNGGYYVDSLAAFYLTGYWFSNKISAPSIVDGALCNLGSQQSCISGFFTEYVATSSTARVGSGHSLGANIVGLYQ